MTQQTYVAEFPIDQLSEHPDNPRRGDETIIDESMEAHGFFGAVLVQKSTGRLIAGNHRTRVARRRGEQSVPALVLDVDDDAARRILLVDNRSNDLAGYDDRSLAALLDDVLDAGDLTGTGFDVSDLDELLTDIAADPRNDVLDYTDDANSDEYYTPAWVFEKMGIEFDLDVASPPEPIPWIPAKRRFTKDDDALTQQWEGRVWMNPPYSQCAAWVRRWVKHRNGVALVPTSNARWLSDVWGDSGIAMAVHPNLGFIGGRISYPLLFMAVGDENVEAIGRLGLPVR